MQSRYVDSVKHLIFIQLINRRYQSGVNGFLDVARQTFKEANADAFQLVSDLGGKSLSTQTLE